MKTNNKVPCIALGTNLNDLHRAVSIFFLIKKLFYIWLLATLLSIFFFVSNQSHAARLDVDYRWDTERSFSYTIRDLDYASLPYPSVCTSKNSCYACVHWANTQYESRNWPVSCTKITPPGALTWDVLGEYFRGKYLPMSGRFSIPVGIDLPLSGIWNFCLAFQSSAYTQAVGSMASLCQDYGITTPVIPDPGTPPPPPLSCAITGEITLAHGILDSDSINSQTKNVNVLVSCTRAATVRITAKANSGGDIVTLRADGSLKSQLKVNGINGATGTTVAVPGSAGSNVQFSSTLISNGEVAGGNFSGSAVALVTII